MGVFDSTAVTTRKLSTTDAFVVTDLPDDVPMAGIVRSAPKVLVDGATWLARSQTYQFAAFGRRAGGASAAVNARPEVRDDAVAAFLAELEPELASGALLLEPAKGLSAAQGDALRATDPRPPVWWEHRHELRGAGVAAAVAGVVAADGATVAIEGFDDAGPALVAGLTERGAVVVSVATAAGTLTRAEGLAADQVAEAWTAHGPGFVAELGGEVGSPAEVLSVSADALVAGSKVGIVDHDAAADLRVRAVVPGGALPVTAKALATLRRAGIVVLPDFVTTAGPLFAWPADGPSPTLDVRPCRGAVRHPRGVGRRRRSSRGSAARRLRAGRAFPRHVDRHRPVRSSHRLSGVDPRSRVAHRRYPGRVRRIGLVLLFALVALGVAGVDVAPAAACSCVGVSDGEAFERADAVFVGEWVETLPGGALPAMSSNDPQRLVFEVSGVYKGEVYARQSVVTAVDGASCGLELAGPGPFLVFGRAAASGTEPAIEDGELAAGLCDGSRAVADRPVPAAFGAPAAPVEGSSPIGGSDGVDAIVAMAVGGALAGAVVLGVRALRRRRSEPPAMPPL